MAEKKERRYAVDFEHFENAMLVEANLGWQFYMNGRWTMPRERRQRITLMLKRFVGELKEEIEKQKENHRLSALQPGFARAVEREHLPNGD